MLLHFQELMQLRFAPGNTPRERPAGEYQQLAPILLREVGGLQHLKAVEFYVAWFVARLCYPNSHGICAL